MLRRVPSQLQLLWRRPIAGPPAPSLAALWILPGRVALPHPPNTMVHSTHYKGAIRTKSCSEECRDTPPRTMRPPCDKARAKPCGPRRPPCGPSYGRLFLYGLLATLAGLGGLYYFGLLDPLLELLGLACLRRYPGEFPGLGWPKKKRARHRHPANSEDLPDCVNYLVVGGGSAGIAAARAIRASDKNARILILTAENAYPYQRTPLSKELWQGGAGACFVASDGTLRSVFYEPENFYVDCKAMASGTRGVAVARGWEVVRIRTKDHSVTLQDGRQIRYEKLLLATGSLPCTLSALRFAKAEAKKKVMSLHDVCDFESLRAALRGGARDVVITGSSAQAVELSAALARHGREAGIPGLRVTLVYPDETPHARVLPVYLGRYLARRLESEGVRVIPKARVRGISMKKNDHAEVRLNTGDRLPACRLVVMAANTPNVGLGCRSGLKVDCKRLGYKANSQLQVKNDIWAAGDCMSFCHNIHGRLRLEGLDHALASGKMAGQNMVASSKNKDGTGPDQQNYTYLPVRWASLAPGASYEAIGDVDARLATVGVFAPVGDGPRPIQPPHPHAVCDPNSAADDPVDYSRGVVFYLRNNMVVGVLLWNLTRRVTAARQIIDNQVPYDELDDAVRQLSLHS